MNLELLKFIVLIGTTVLANYIIIIRRIDQNKSESELKQERILKEISENKAEDKLTQEKILGKLDVFNNQLKNWNIQITQQVEHVQTRSENNELAIKEHNNRLFKIEGKIETLEKFQEYDKETRNKQSRTHRPN